MANPFTYVQLHTGDHAKAKAFYAGLFDWQFDDQPIPGGTYTEVLVGEGTGGGILDPTGAALALWQKTV